jgi:hypothetical protein
VVEKLIEIKLFHHGGLFVTAAARLFKGQEIAGSM